MLAQELIDIILDHLHSDRESLKECAFVSRSFLPTCRLHLFATLQISNSNIDKVSKLLIPPPSDAFTKEKEEDCRFRARIIRLLNKHTTDLTFVAPWDWDFNPTHCNFPKFAHLRRIVFEGDDPDYHMLPMHWWDSKRFRSVESIEVNFVYMDKARLVLNALCNLPSTVKNISFTATRTARHLKFPSLDDVFETRTDTYHFEGTLGLNLCPGISYQGLLLAILRHKDLNVLKFGLKCINFNLTCRADIHPFALLVNECKNTLEYLNINYSTVSFFEGGVEVKKLDFSQHSVLRSIKVQSSAEKFNSDWLCAAISSTKLSNGNPRNPPLQFELHISLKYHPRGWGLESYFWNDSREADHIVNSWIPVDTELSDLIGSSPGAFGIMVHVSVTNVSTGERKGKAKSMFPLISETEGWLEIEAEDEACEAEDEASEDEDEDEGFGDEDFEDEDFEDEDSEAEDEA